MNIIKKEYIGILLGALYTILFRYLDGFHFESVLITIDFSVNSFTFFLLVPMVVGILPILIAQNEIDNSRWKHFLYPIISNLFFIVYALLFKLEDLGCGIIILPPLLLVSGIIGLLVGLLLKRKNNNKLYSVLFLPFLFVPIENLITNQDISHDVESNIIINNNSTYIWNNIIEVPEIKKHEYQRGFFSYIGIPYPIKSKIEIIGNEKFRMGYFSDGLILAESIEEMEPNKMIRFKIHIDKSKLRNTPMDQHVLKNDYFQFSSISYHLKQVGNGQTKLTLKCKYKINSMMNAYANFWAYHIIKDFEVRLLNALQVKFDRKVLKTVHS
ncbi:hypothetical protein G6N05_13645 [Flavobacterium sp. F372]|uniref:SRPBCC family protein n=1 Tax=Flavobacterium bernardetii TaxID=2813823 RepID=A0ABR7J1N5_9FLAO|nr:hypothetical protein [Flavobacterium bernardetii]MBC5835897.1 hypothetical protein [Flavobacterium bernardetii]NHF71157.1 hypothetical protein [Flavobacterium bernardetii]